MKELSESELKQKLSELKQKLFEARLKKAKGELKNVCELRNLRRDVARVLTAIKEKAG